VGSKKKAKVITRMIWKDFKEKSNFTLKQNEKIFWKNFNNTRKR